MFNVVLLINIHFSDLDSDNHPNFTSHVYSFLFMCPSVFVFVHRSLPFSLYKSLFLSSPRLFLSRETLLINITVPDVISVSLFYCNFFLSLFIFLFNLLSFVLSFLLFTLISRFLLPPSFPYIWTYVQTIVNRLLSFVLSSQLPVLVSFKGHHSLPLIITAISKDRHLGQTF